MKDLQAPNLSDITKALQPITKHGTLIITLLLLGFVIAAAYSVTSILQRASDNNYRNAQQSSLTKTKFDQATIDRIKSLRSTSQSSDDLDFSVNQERKNPFTERLY